MTALLSSIPPAARQAVLSAVVFVCGVVLAWVLRIFWAYVLIPLANKTRTDLDRSLLEAAKVPVYLLAVVYAFYFAVERLSREPDLGGTLFVEALGKLAYVALVLSVTAVVGAVFQGFFRWYLKEVANRTRTAVDEEFVELLRRVVKILLLFVAATVILSYFKVNITGFLATAGVLSLAVALAAQETLANTISGFMLILDRPFRVGDLIQLESGDMGYVQEIGLRTTKILSFENTLLIVPNSEIAKRRITNRNYPDTRIRIRQQIGVAYGSDLVKVKRVLVQICAAHPDVLKDPEPVVRFTEFGDSSLNLVLAYWIPDVREQFRVTDEVNMEIKRRFEEEGIGIPFPQRDVHIRRP